MIRLCLCTCWVDLSTRFSLFVMKCIKIINDTKSMLVSFDVNLVYTLINVRCTRAEKYSNSNASCINMHLISLLSAELILWPICALSRFRLSPKSLETSQHGGQGLLSPFYSHLFEFRKFLPLDRSQRRIILFIYIYMLIIYNFNNRKKKLVL